MSTPPRNENRLLILGLLVFAAFGLALIVFADQVGGIWKGLFQGVGLALLTTAAVTGPLTAIENRQLTEAASSSLKHFNEVAAASFQHFVSLGSEQTTELILQQLLHPKLIAALRKSTFGRPYIDHLQFQIFLQHIPDGSDLSYRFTRAYTIPNKGTTPIRMTLLHTHEKPLRSMQVAKSGFRDVVFTLRLPDEQFETKTFDISEPPATDEPMREFRGTPISVTGYEPNASFVAFSYDLEVPPRSEFSIKVTSHSAVREESSVPLVCAYPTLLLEVSVWHDPGIKVELFPLYGLPYPVEPMKSTEEAPPEFNVRKETWVLDDGFFPGQGVQLRWSGLGRSAYALPLDAKAQTTTN